jgi:radical SAM protein with 4Fe4S-binding SPASM domain
MNTNIPINKGNYSLDTPEREDAFNRKRAFGVEDAYWKNREEWEEYPRKQYVADYPLLIDMELSTICNLKCPFCYTITDEFAEKVSRRFMDFELVKKIIDEIAGKVFAVRLSLRGEPTLYPQFIEVIKYAKQNGIKEISTLTNGSKLTVDFFCECQQAGLDWITMSVDGIYEEYEKNRMPLKFNFVYNNLKAIKNIKDKLGIVKPVIKIQSVWSAIKENPSEFYTVMSEVSDLLAFNPLIDFNHVTPLDKIPYEPSFSCPQLYQRLTIGSDGSALLCANDENGEYISGDINKETVYQIWHGEQLNHARKLHQNPDGFKEINVCKKCYIPRKTIEERYTVCGRDLIVKNYL